MSAISKLLQFDTSTIEAPKLFPEGEFKAKIAKAEILPFYWASSETFGLMYVPEIEIIDYVPSGSEAIDKKTMAQLEAFGDWVGFKRQWARSTDKIPGATEKRRVGGIANNLNYPLYFTDSSFEELTEQSPQMSRFYLAADKSPSGRPRGFIVDVLKMNPKPGTNLQQLISDTEGKSLYVTLKHRQEGDYDPSLEVDSTAPAGK